KAWPVRSAQCRPPSPPPPASPPASKAAPRRADRRPSPSAGSPARPRNTTEKPSSPSPPRQPRPLPSSTHPPPESEDHDRFSSSSICHANFQSIALLAGALAVVLVGVQVYRQMVVPGHWSWDAAGQITQFILVLLVASVPVALPAVMSVTLALGALALSKQKAIVSRLSAIDELAGVDVLCSDKTGTLTQNKLTLSTPIPFGN